MKKLSKLVNTFGGKSLGTIFREWWNKPLFYPWPAEDQEAVEQPDAIQVCHRCLTPQEHLGWFCPHCGAATGPYNNLMPFINIFSTGEVLRAGVDSKTRFAKWVYPVYFVIGLFEYFFFAPIYWVRLLRAGIKRAKEPPAIDHENEN